MKRDHALVWHGLLANALLKHVGLILIQMLIVALLHTREILLNAEREGSLPEQQPSAGWPCWMDPWNRSIPPASCCRRTAPSVMPRTAILRRKERRCTFASRSIARR